MPLAAGARLGPYETQSLIGAGGMGEVYRARDWWIIYVHLAEGDRAGARRIADLWWNKADKSANERYGDWPLLIRPIVPGGVTLQSRQ